MPFVLRPPGETLSIVDQLKAVAFARRLTLVFTGAFQCAAILLASVELACALDAAVHLHPAVRALSLFAILASVGVAFVRGVWLPIRSPMKPLGVAMLLEAKYPRLNDALASAVEFQTLAPPGSERFRKVAMARAAVALDKCNTNALVPSGGAWRNLGLFALAVFAAVPLIAVNRERAQVAILRLASPYGEHFWPTRTKLQLLEPSQFPARLAKGDAFDLKMSVGGVLPERVTVAVRFETGAGWEEIVTLPEGVDTVECAARLDASRVPRDFQFQVRANDAVTPWYEVKVAEPPKFAPLNGRPSPQLRATYPDYTRLPESELPDGATVVEAVVGTRLNLRAATDRRIASAVLVPQMDRKPLAMLPAIALLAGANPFLAYAGAELASGSLADIPVNVSGSDANLLSAEFTPSISGLHALRFTDESGITGTRLFDFRMTADPSPIVTLEQPPPTGEALILLPTASITLVARAEDRTFAVRKLALEYRVGSDAAPWREIVLNDPANLVASAPALLGSALPPFDPQFITLAGGGTFPLASFTKPDGHAPAPGDRITLRAAATDYDDIAALKQPGRSREVEIRIASAASLEGLLQQQLALLRPQVLKLREDQRQARERVEEFAASPSAEGRAKLGEVERDQQTIRNRVADPRDGLRAKAGQMQELIRKNELSKSSTTERVDAVAEELARLSEQTLEGIEPRIASARQNPKSYPASLEAKQAIERQTAVEKSFDLILERLQKWGGASEMRAEALALKEALGKIGEDAAREAEKVPAGKPPEMLTASEKSALGKPAGKLNQLAERIASALGKAEGQASEKERTAEDAAQAESKALRDAIQQAGGQQLIDDVRTAAKELEKNSASKSAAAIRAAGEKLDKFADALGEKKPDTGDVLEKKKATADALDKLAEEQDQLAKKAKAAANAPDELMKLAPEQEALRKKVEAAAEKLSRERQTEAAEQLRKSAEKMAAAQAALEEGKAPGDQQNEALDRLEEAVKKLDRDREKDEAQLSKEKREQLAEQLKAIREKLAAADTEAGRLQTDVLKQMAWDRGKIASLGDLDDRVRAVAEELRKFTEKNLGELPVFKQLAEQAAESADRAAKRFAERKNDTLDAIADPFDAKLEGIADDRTRRPLRTAIRRLDHILEAMKEDAKKPPAAFAEKPPMTPENPPMPMPMGDQQMPPTAQVKALRALQAELNERTAAFAKAHPDRMKLAEADREELDELERSQREVAELFQKLAPMFKPPGM